MPFTDETLWDATRFADSVRSTVGRKDGQESEQDSRLSAYFPESDFGEIRDPAIIQDQYGRIMCWILPEVLHPNRLVCETTFTPVVYYIIETELL